MAAEQLPTDESQVSREAEAENAQSEQQNWPKIDQANRVER
jgi:hypothetical protein